MHAGIICGGRLTWRARSRTASRPFPRGRASPDTKYVAFSGRFVIIGFGSIEQGVLPLLRHVDIRPDQIVVVTAELRGHEVAEEYGVRFVETALIPGNCRTCSTAGGCAGVHLGTVRWCVSPSRWTSTTGRRSPGWR
jgi:hypothetical protein